LNKCGYVSIIGEPNSGKSTLLNYLLGYKLSIVSWKNNTTIRQIIGCKTINNSQIIFIDTPGITATNCYIKSKALIKTSLLSLSQSDVVILLVDVCYKKIFNLYKILITLKNINLSHLILCINKIDKVDKKRILNLTLNISKRINLKRIFMISATTGSGVNDLESYLENYLPIRDWLYPSGKSTNLSDHDIVSDTVREKIFFYLHKEIPYNIFVKTRDLTNIKGKLVANVDIFIKNSGYKAILLGKNGKTITHIIMCSSNDLEKFFSCKLSLKIFIKTYNNTSLK
jgi:GTP-binding protein Era